MSSRSQNALARLSATNPVSEARLQNVVDASWRNELLARLIREPPPQARTSVPTRARFVLIGAIGAAVIGLAAVPAYGIGRTIVEWVIGEPAPPEIVHDFGQYTPQLGFNPEPGKAVMVAADQDLRLYVTRNRQGTYCFIVNTRLDGGSCVSAAVASAPVVAGFAGGAPPRGDGQRLVIVGRIQDAAARSVRFTAPSGTAIAVRIGAGGFFVAGVAVNDPIAACAAGEWAPSFSFLDGEGAVVAREKITIAVGFGTEGRGGCSYGSLHEPSG